MQFDLEQNIAFFETAQPEVGAIEREALRYPADWEYVSLDALAARIKQRLVELIADKNYRDQGVIQMIDADLHSRRPDLYL